MNIDLPLQMSLGVSLRDDATFENFYVSADNELSIAMLRGLVNSKADGSAYLVWGKSGSGLTHLLQSLSLEFHQKHHSVQYLPLVDMVGFSARDICEGLESTQLVCLDGLDHICGKPDWERAVFHLFNNLRDAGHTLVLSSHLRPASLPVSLNDLKSRLLGSMFLHIHSLSDEDKQRAIIMRANARGIDMPLDVAKYILSHASRDTSHLFFLLNCLDEASLQQQRKLTIPFVREVLGI